MKRFVYACSSLAEITLSSNVSLIENEAFKDCDSLTSVVFKNTLGWYICSTKDAESGDEIDVTDSSINDDNLTKEYCNYYFKR